ncbi:MAG: ADP-ribosylglycohydrolase family protein [Alphaproteobacteria bacterium]|jgi:ADP-ribosylglycohydrolase|nr:ADP-ribosylglycohydrolase family protein [Alphaproteobacteria bacterium]
MLGAIAGDIIGSIYERHQIKSKKFPLFGRGCGFTDDTVCTVAVAEWLLDGGDFAAVLRRHVRRHPKAGYGGMFLKWALADDAPAYNSWGNGSAMRAAPIAYAADDEADVLRLAAESSAVSHDHPDAIKGAQAVALATWAALGGADGAEIGGLVEDRFGYDMTQSLDQIRWWYRFDVSAKGSVPQAIQAAIEGTDYEDAVRCAISIGGDSDTIACMAGAVAEARFGLPEAVAERALDYLSEDLRAVVERFGERFPTP